MTAHDPSPRPFVHINFAVYADGRVAEASGRAAPISCARDWQRVHALRETYAAVCVGAQTWLRDQPRLNVRSERLGREPQRQPDRVIFAGSQPCDIRDDGRRTFVIGRQLRFPAGVIAIESEDHDLRRPLERLRARYRVESLLVEGGPTLLRSFTSQRLVDRITIFVKTDRVDRAEEAAHKVIPDLPAGMTRELFGDGVLISYRPS